MMEDWRALRSEVEDGQVSLGSQALLRQFETFFYLYQKPLYDDIQEDGPIEEVTQKFFELQEKIILVIRNEKTNFCLFFRTKNEENLEQA